MKIFLGVLVFFNMVWCSEVCAAQEESCKHVLDALIKNKHLVGNNYRRFAKAGYEGLTQEAHKRAATRLLEDMENPYVLMFIEWMHALVTTLESQVIQGLKDSKQSDRQETGALLHNMVRAPISGVRKVVDDAALMSSARSAAAACGAGGSGGKKKKDRGRSRSRAPHASPSGAGGVEAGDPTLFQRLVKALSPSRSHLPTSGGDGLTTPLMTPAMASSDEKSTPASTAVKSRGRSLERKPPEAGVARQPSLLRRLFSPPRTAVSAKDAVPSGHISLLREKEDENAALRARISALEADQKRTSSTSATAQLVTAQAEVLSLRAQIAMQTSTQASTMVARSAHEPIVAELQRVQKQVAELTAARDSREREKAALTVRVQDLVGQLDLAQRRIAQQIEELEHYRKHQAELVEQLVPHVPEAAKVSRPWTWKK